MGVEIFPDSPNKRNFLFSRITWNASDGPSKLLPTGFFPLVSKEMNQLRS